MRERDVSKENVRLSRHRVFVTSRRRFVHLDVLADIFHSLARDVEPRSGGGHRGRFWRVWCSWYISGRLRVRLFSQEIPRRTLVSVVHDRV